MATNHLLLCALGVGHQSLDAVRACCLSRECPCKLTGNVTCIITKYILQFLLAELEDVGGHLR